MMRIGYQLKNESKYRFEEAKNVEIGTGIAVLLVFLSLIAITILMGGIY